jgi:hypothetical protein
VSSDVNMPIIPDKVVDKIRKGKSVPLEEVSAAAAEYLGVERERRSAPVHAENLRPISRATAKSLVEGSAGPAVESELGMHGRGLPNFPSTRRVIPAPFQRPSVTGGQHGMTWQTDVASRIAEGDMVMGIGRVITRLPDQTRYSTYGDVVGELPGLTSEERERPVAVGTDVVCVNVVGDSYNVDVRAEVSIFRRAADAAAAP